MFFNRYQRGKKALYQVKQPNQRKARQVNFNRSNKWGWWIPPTLGEIYFSLGKRKPDSILISLGKKISLSCNQN